jgi:hypothetical protein
VDQRSGHTDLQSELTGRFGAHALIEDPVALMMRDVVPQMASLAQRF